MSNISEYFVAKDATINEVAVIYRCFLEAGGQGIGGLTIALKITNPAGTNVTLVENTDWRKVERSNVCGDYEVIIGLSNFTTFGQYTIEIDSQDPGVGKLVTHFTLKGVYGTVVSGASPTGFVTDLPSITTDFYQDSFLLMIGGTCDGSGPKKVSAYTSGKAITIKALPLTPSIGDAFYLVRF